MAIANLRLMIERRMRDLEDERRRREGWLRLERMETEEEVAEEGMEAMRKVTRQRVRWVDAEEDARETGAMARR